MSDPLNLGDLGYPTVETVRRAEAYHRILLDLIAELREGSEMWGIHPAADRAEARLRGILVSSDHEERRRK